MRAQVNTAPRGPTVQSCFCAAVVHVDILQSLPAPTLWPQSTPTTGRPWLSGGPLLLPGVLEFNTRASNAYIQSQVLSAHAKLFQGCYKCFIYSISSFLKFLFIYF